MTAAALAVSLLVVFDLTGAVADVTMETAPPFDIQYGDLDDWFGAILVVSAQDQQTQPCTADFEYTVSDKDTFTPGPPPPPPGPYNGPGHHIDDIFIYDQALVNLDPDWCTGYFRPQYYEGRDHVTTSAHLEFNNQSGQQRTVNIQIRWEDGGVEAMGVPEAQRHGTAYDGVLYKYKVIYVAPR